MTSQQASERVVNGIKTRVLHGKDYVEVHERVNQIQHDKEAQGFSMVKQERYEWNGRHFLSITIEVKGKQYIGDAEVTFDAARSTPAGSNPIETAQTSALGRALAFAGFGTVESIASYDEIARNQPGVLVIEASQEHVVEAAPASRQIAQPNHISVGSLYERGKAQKLWTTGDEFYPWLSERLGKPVTRESVRLLTQAELAEMAKQIYEHVPAGVSGAN